MVSNKLTREPNPTEAAPHLIRTPTTMYVPSASLSGYSVAMNSLTASFTARICATRRDLLHIRHRSFHPLTTRRVATKLTPPRIVCMAVSHQNHSKQTQLLQFTVVFFLIRAEFQEPYLITKLESAEKTWQELSVCLPPRATMLPFSANNIFSQRWNFRSSLLIQT